MAYTPCSSTDQYLKYDHDESGTIGIYGTAATCTNKLLFGQECKSQQSCNYNKGLVCSDQGCICEADDKYWNPVDERCVLKTSLCQTSSTLICGSCIEAINQDKTFSQAETYCSTQNRFQHLHIIKNKAQWYYDTNTTGTDPYWVINILFDLFIIFLIINLKINFF